MAMGCADLIPGVSGGTIALITGIYDELIKSMKFFNYYALHLLINLKIRDFWMYVNGIFLLHIILGVFISFISLSRLIRYLLVNHSIPLWSFFFGLIFVSAFYIIPRRKNVSVILFLLLGGVIGYSITSFSSLNSPEYLWFIFISGGIAICAMILPGISGSFILILLGKFEYILLSLMELNLKVILAFGLGCAVGLLSFSRLIHWLLDKHKSSTMAFLAGFMLGSLNKVWPWKKFDGGVFTNLSPFNYNEITGQPDFIYLSFLFCILGCIVVVFSQHFVKGDGTN